MKKLIAIFLSMIMCATSLLADELIVTVVKDGSGFHVHDQPSAMSIDFEDIEHVQDYLLTEDGNKQEKNLREAIRYLIAQDDTLSIPVDHISLTVNGSVVTP